MRPVSSISITPKRPAHHHLTTAQGETDPGRNRLAGAWLLALASGCLLALGETRAADQFTAFPENETTVSCMQGGAAYLDLTLIGWGPQWAWLGFSGRVREQDGEALLAVSAQIGDSRVQVNTSTRKIGPRQLRLDIEVHASKNVELTGIFAALEPAQQRFAQGKAIATGADGTVRDIALPLARKGLGDAAVRQFVIVDDKGARTTFTLEPACPVPSDGAARIQLAGSALKAEAPVRVALTIDFPGDLAWHTSSRGLAADAGFDSWYEFRPDNDHALPSEIGLEDWIEAPAGPHGRIRRQADQLVCGGKPIKLWGLNLCYGACAPEHALAEKRARFYRKFGINAVRLHKYAEGGTLSQHSYTEFDPEGLDRMDYLVAQLKQQGIYVELSTQFGTPPLGRADTNLVPYLEEFGSFSGRSGHITPPHSASHFSPELQNAHIRHMVNLLKHRNPHTGLTYAEEPALAYIEIINEQSILFYTSMAPLKASPTLRQKVGRRFSDWLKARYGTHEKLLAAWGPQAFDSFANEGFKGEPERLDCGNILPLGNPWYWDPIQLQGSQRFRQRRLLDSLRFLYELQNEFYDRFVEAARAAGYQGEFVASNWQAGRGYSHFYNLHSDARIGTVDRHNYFGGGSSTRIDNVTMLTLPGSGLLSSGMQQVAGHPFMFSEWIHVTPNEWGVEGPAIIGAYGLGLQGWDASFMFQNSDNATFSAKIGRDRWDVTAPNVLGIFPAVARQVLRGDVAEASVCAPVYVHLPSLDLPKLGFDDTVTQQYDIKTFESDAVPAAALAAARCVVEFTDAYRDTPRFDLAKYRRDGWIASSTGQLRWRTGQTKLDGFFTIDTPGTKAVVGFAENQICALGPVTITPRSRFAAIYVTAKEPDCDLVRSRRLLIVAMARARNTGMKVLHDERILEPGQPPVVLEPVRARIALRKSGTPVIMPLDHNGRRTALTLPFQNGAFEIDGARDRTCYYLAEYP